MLRCQGYSDVYHGFSFPPGKCFNNTVTGPQLLSPPHRLSNHFIIWFCVTLPIESTVKQTRGTEVNSILRYVAMYFYSKNNQMHQCIRLILFWTDTLHVSDGFSVHNQEFKTVHTAAGICQTDTAVCLLASRQQYLFDCHSKTK